jgi:hypothetical protein
MAEAVEDTPKLKEAAFAPNGLLPLWPNPPVLGVGASWLLAGALIEDATGVDPKVKDWAGPAGAGIAPNVGAFPGGAGAGPDTAAPP